MKPVLLVILVAAILMLLPRLLLQQLQAYVPQKHKRCIKKDIRKDHYPKDIVSPRYQVLLHYLQ